MSRKLALIVSVALGAAMAFAPGVPLTGTPLAAFAQDAAASQTKALKRGLAHLAKGRSEFSRAAEQKTNAQRLKVLDRALYFLKRADAVTAKGTGASFDDLRADVKQSRIQALLDQASIHFARKSLKKAESRAEEVLALDAENAKAKALLKAITDARENDIYDDNQGSAAVNRIRNRRAAAGVPLRDRGAARRR